MNFLVLILFFINRDQKIKMFGIVTTFVATRSGLTRFEDHRSEAEKLDSTGERPFFDTHTRQLHYNKVITVYSERVGAAKSVY
jgi:hypothetical protein